MRTPLAACLVCLLSVTAAADEVFLTKGGRLRGVVEQDGQWVRVAHAGGSARAAVTDVLRIRREPRAQMLWLQAKQARQSGNAKSAGSLLRRLVTLEDGPYALKARRELELMGEEGLLGPTPVEALEPRRALELAWRALASDDLDLAVQAALQAYGPTLERRRRSDELRVEYVLGRTHELRGHDLAARTFYGEIVRAEAEELPETLPVGALRLLARLHAAGTRVEPIPPGGDQPWRLTEGPRISLLHLGEGARLLEQAEYALTDVAGSLDLPRTPEEHRVLLVCYPTLASYQASRAHVDASFGFAHRRGPGGEVERSAVMVAGDEDTLRHELAHLVTSDAFAGHPLPRWVEEGSASSVSFRRRELRRERARRLYRERRFGSFLELRRTDPATLRGESVSDFYAKALVVYQALAKHLIGEEERVFEFALDAEQVGIEVALARIGLTPARFYALIRAELEP